MAMLMIPAAFIGDVSPSGGAGAAVGDSSESGEDHDQECRSEYTVDHRLISLVRLRP